uniref:Dysbindin domain containing 2 n=2 Tax=Saimiri boliviensis boliviensis TaxID=39432 RepID=A0A2K6UJL4_SAIBB
MRAGNFLTALEVPAVALAGAASDLVCGTHLVSGGRGKRSPRAEVSRLEPGAPLLGCWLQWGSLSPGPCPHLLFRLCSCTSDMDPNPRATLERQQLRLRERQKFFEDILQPETEFVFPLSHLHLESQRPPIGSISSMEVNVDTLEQVELIDLGDQDGADVFLPCEDPPPTPQSSGVDSHLEELSLPVPASDRTTSRTSSSSSDSSTNLHSPNPSDDGADTPLAQSDEEEERGDGGAEPGACS